MREILKGFLKEETVEYLVKQYPSPRLLMNATEQELEDAPFIGKVKAKQLRSIFQLSQLLLHPEQEITKIKSPAEAFQHMSIMRVYEEERVAAIYLDTANKIIDTIELSKGSINTAPVSPKDFFAHGCRLRASGAILCHNHPADGEPSQEDIAITLRLKQAGELIGIILHDSIIVCSNRYISMKERGLM